MLIDTHCHLNFDGYDEDRAAVIARAAEQGVTRVIIPSVELETGPAVLALADAYPSIYAAVGIHPNSTADFEAAHLETIEAQSKHAKVVAIGEIGLDYHWDNSPKEKQWFAFEQQLELAARLNLPVIIHNREASEDVMAILAKWIPTLPEELRTRPGVLHSFSAPANAAKQALEMGFYLGFTGPITYKNAEGLRVIASSVPRDRLVVETDGPFLTPHPHRGQRNEPAYVKLVAARLAAIHQIPEEEMFAATTQNAERLFALNG